MPLTSTSVIAGAHNIEVGVISPALSQASTASTVVVTDSDVDVRGYKSLSYTIIVATQNVDWSVFGANVSDFSDEVAVLAAVTVAAGAKSSYTVAPPPFAYYRVKIIDTGGGLHGTVTINAIAKP